MEKMIELTSKKVFPTFLMTPDDKKKYPGLIVIEEIWGLNDHIKDVAKRFAKEGYIVLSPELLSETGITEKADQSLLEQVKNPATRDEAQKKLRVLFAPLQSPEFAESAIAKLKVCVDYLFAHKQVNSNVGVLGFCFGGTYAYALAAVDSRIKAAVPFYGHAPEPHEEIKGIQCPVLAFYGEQDEGLMSTLPEVKKAMKKYGKDFEAVVYSNTGHAFFNDTNPNRYNKKATEDAWKKSLKFLSGNLNK
jgi:carboxymethylenebutenolidase